MALEALKIVQEIHEQIRTPSSKYPSAAAAAEVRLSLPSHAVAAIAERWDCVGPGVGGTCDEAPLRRRAAKVTAKLGVSGR